jgi:hypothetical protein
MMVASAIITGTWMTRMTSVLRRALKKAGSEIIRAQLNVGLKTHGLTRVECNEIQNELMIGQIQKIRNTNR